jgi:hypothetical protein
LHSQTKEIDQLEATRADQAAHDPRQRWDVLNGKSIIPLVPSLHL